jgi:hypothetical protein
VLQICVQLKRKSWHLLPRLLALQHTHEGQHHAKATLQHMIDQHVHSLLSLAIELGQAFLVALITSLSLVQCSPGKSASVLERADTRR